jgi:predicted TIM-barrel fold metal-dependent hydrolase
MAIVDAQVHIWSKGTTIPPHLDRPYLVDEAIRDMDEAGVDAAILTPPGWDEDSNALSIAAARAHPERFAVLGSFPLDRPESRALVTTWKQQFNMLGLRFYFMDERTRTWPMDGTMDWLWSAAEKAGLPVAVLAGDWLPLLMEKAVRHPDLKIIVDHMGALRGAKGDAAFPAMQELTAMARLPNVAVKMTGGPFYADDPYPFKSLHKHYRRIFDAFGPNRMFWGSDITKMPCPWRQCVTHFQEIDWLSEADRRLIMGDAICAWLDWKR